MSQTGHPKVYIVGGKEIVVDEDGFLEKTESWSEELVEILAKEEGLEELTETQWRFLRFLREYYLTYGKTPKNSEMKKGAGLSIAEIQACFPGGIRKTARRLAGLPNQKGCG